MADFVIQVAKTDQNFKCFGCRMSDGMDHIDIICPEQDTLHFHRECLNYFVGGIIRFKELFLDKEETQVESKVLLN